jgi:hypothetical protein
VAWGDWDRRRRKRARGLIGAWAILMFGALLKVFTDGILPYLQLRASVPDAGGDALLSAGLEAAKAGGGMILILLAAGAAGLLLLRSLDLNRVLLGERPADRPEEDRDAGH